MMNKIDADDDDVTIVSVMTFLMMKIEHGIDG